MPSTDQYIAWAAAACGHARKVIDECATEINLSKDEIWQRYTKIASVRFNLFSRQESFYRLLGMPNDSYYLWLKRTVKNVRQIRAGNCTEYARLALNYLRKVAAAGVRLEIVRILEGDHVFVVIGRTTDFARFAKGEDDGAVICDPYASQPENRIYPAREIKSRLHCFRCLTNTGEPWPYLNEEYPFDPDQHKLGSYYELSSAADAKQSQRDIATVQNRIAMIKKYLAAEHITSALPDIEMLEQEIRAYQDNTSLQHVSLLDVQRFLNKMMKRSALKLFAIPDFNVLQSRLGESLVLDVLLNDYRQNGDVADFARSINLLLSHLHDDVLKFVFDIMSRHQLLSTMTSRTYSDAYSKEVHLTLMTLVLKRRNSDVFTHLVSLMPANDVYECMLSMAFPRDRFLRWVDEYPDNIEVMTKLLVKLQDILTPFDVRTICLISDDMAQAVLDHQETANKLKFIGGP